MAMPPRLSLRQIIHGQALLELTMPIRKISACKARYPGERLEGRCHTANNGGKMMASIGALNEPHNEITCVQHAQCARHHFEL
jgi:hypothetical protein